MIPSQNTSSPASFADTFATTRWTVVLAAGQGDTPQSEAALEQLCRSYWYPIYAYIRRRGRSKEDAEDLAQAFFSRFLEKNYLESVEAGRGRFRAFLLASVKHFLANEWDRSQCQKRGGNAVSLSLDWQNADTQFRVFVAAGQSPDQVFDREWAISLLAKVIERLRAECADANRGLEFDELKIFLTAGKGALSHAAAAATLGIDEGTVRVAVHRLRKRYRKLLRDEIAQTLDDPGQVDEEMKALFAAFAA